MRILIFPFYVERTDDMQGVYGRQVARLISEDLQKSGINTKHIQWLAPKGDAQTHVCIEAPLPRNILDEEAATHGADQVILGRIRVVPEQTLLEIVAHLPHDADNAEPRPLFKEEGAVHALPDMVERASAVLGAYLSGTPAPSASLPPSKAEKKNAAAHFERWRDALLAHDAQELIS